MSITWNGVNSDTIGVIVERIPNRYVPTRRFSPQQVAGRNGNILLVDKAFPNVEQEYEVYLSAESQGLPSVARACAEWLMGPDGYCRLTDSYDTTVYREAFLMGGFDIENILNKFGRCTITFSCKPQKYLLTGDTPIEIPGGPTTYTGDVVQFDGITGASITSLSATITPTQDLHGYDSPWPAGGGKNLAGPYDSNISVLNGLTVTQSADGTITIDGTSTTYASYVRGSFLCDDVSAEYTWSLNNSAAYGTSVQFSVRKANYDPSGGWQPVDAVNKTYTFTPGSGTQPVYWQFQINQGTTLNNAKFKVQIEQGSTATSWTPFSNICPISGRTGLSVYVSPTTSQADATTYAVDWTDEAGTVYGGTLDVVTGVLTVDRAMVDMGTLNWNIYNTQFYAQLVDAKIPSYYEMPNAICSMFRPVQFGALLSNDNAFAINSGQSRVNIVASAYSTLAEFETAMSGQQLVYELATPVTYQLTPQEVEALVGTNNVWSSSGDVSVTVTTPLGGIVTNPTPFEARPLLAVSGVGEITINGKSIQILESVSDFEIDCETMEAEDNSKIYCMDFPQLSGGENEIVSDGSITALTVTPRWWTL